MNFTILDLRDIFLALLVWLVIFTGQGILIGWATNVFKFRSRTLLRQLGLASLLSASVLPCLYNLIALVGGIKAVVWVIGSSMLALIPIAVIERQRLSLRLHHLRREIHLCRFILIVEAIWLVLSIFLAIDIQIDHRLYVSMTMYDHSARIGLAEAIARTGVPPASPFFFPGHQVPIFIHYYWVLLCTAISTICGSAYNTRIALLAGVTWSGIAFLSGLIFFCSYFKTSSVRARQVTFYCLALLTVSNLYILFTGLLNFWSLNRYGYPCRPSIGWWTTEHVEPWVQIMLWVPHYSLGLIACILASILVLEAGQEDKWQQRMPLIILAGCCLASAFGLAASIAVGFAVTWAIWGAWELWRKNLSGLVITIGAAAVALLITIPYLKVLAGGASNTGKLVLGVRHFELVDWTLAIANAQPSEAIHQLLYFLALPINYLIGLGFVLVGAILFWRQRLPAEVETDFLKRKKSFLIVMSVAGLLLGTFVRSQLNNNDFGWRVMMLVQLPLLLWCAEYLAILEAQKRKLSLFNKFLIALGVSTFLYSLYLDRTSLTYFTRADRTYDIRAIYQDLERQLPPDAVVQHNPIAQFWRVDIFANLYSHRQVVLTAKAPASNSKTADSDQYAYVNDQLTRLYMDPPLSEAIAICHQLKINALLVKDTDKLFYNKSAWVWKFPIIAENAHARAFLIEKPPQFANHGPEH